MVEPGPPLSKTLGTLPAASMHQGKNNPPPIYFKLEDIILDL